MTEQEFIEKELNSYVESKGWMKDGASNWISNIFKKGFEKGKEFSEENNKYKSIVEQIATSTQPYNSRELNIWQEIVMKLTNDALTNQL